MSSLRLTLSSQIADLSSPRTARQEMAEQKSRAVKLYESARQTLEASSPDVHAAYQSFITEKGVQPADDLETQAQEMRDTLHLTAEVAGGVLQNFEDRKKEVRGRAASRSHAFSTMRTDREAAE